MRVRALQPNPTVRPLHVFRSDMGTVDNYLSFWIDNLHQLGSSLLVLIVVVSVVVPQVIVLEVLCLVSFVFLIEAVDRSNREMKRISNNCMGPILSNVQEALNGRVLSRAMGLSSYFPARHTVFVNVSCISADTLACLASSVTRRCRRGASI